MYKHLTSEQRYYIYKEYTKGSTQKSIAKTIGVSESTVSRELKRNRGKSGGYNFLDAQRRAEEKSHRTPGNRAIAPHILWQVKELIIDKQWSPMQISGTLKKQGISISHETIYKLIRDDPTGELASNCRNHMHYKKKAKHHKQTKATNIPNRTSIHQRPPQADGNRFGDWEMDLIVDGQQHAILNLTERSTDLMFIEKLKYGKKALPIAKAVYRLLLPFKGKGLLTITTDNGSEFAAHEWITKKLGVKVYFTDAYASWQKGNVENNNKLIRQYIPKGTNFNSITDKQLKSIQNKINARPRLKLNFNSPKNVFFKLLY